MGLRRAEGGGLVGEFFSVACMYRSLLYAWCRELGSGGASGEGGDGGEVTYLLYPVLHILSRYQ